MKKVLLVHPGKQHSFQTAQALKEAGVLYKYVTTVYDKEGSLTHRFMNLLSGKNLKKAKTRHCDCLEDSDVIQIYEWLGLLVLLVSKVFGTGWLYWHLNYLLSQKFADKTARMAVKENVDAIIVYDGICRKGLEYIKRKAPHIVTIMDVSISMRPFMKENFEKDMQLYHHDGLKREEGYLWKKRYERIIRNELKFVDYFFSPSQVVRDSLVFCGVDTQKIIIVPYGVDVSKFSFKQKTLNENAPLKLIYVGQISYRKGLHHLLKIVKEKGAGQVDLVLAGDMSSNNEFVARYSQVENIHFAGFVTRDILASFYQQADAFVLPSLGEGLALVVLEAMSTGLPCIVSNLTGGNDAVDDYANGVVYDALSEDALRDAIDWMIAHRDHLPEMSVRARATAEGLTWEAYHRNYALKLNSLLEKDK